MASVGNPLSLQSGSRLFCTSRIDFLYGKSPHLQTCHRPLLGVADLHARHEGGVDAEGMPVMARLTLLWRRAAGEQQQAQAPARHPSQTKPSESAPRKHTC